MSRLLEWAVTDRRFSALLHWEIPSYGRLAGMVAAR